MKPNVSENIVTTKESFKTLAGTPDLPELEGNVTAVVAKVNYTATHSQEYRKGKHSGRRCTSNNIIRVLLDSGSLSWKCRRRVVSPDPPKRHVVC